MQSQWFSVSSEPWKHLLALEASHFRAHAHIVGSTGSGKSAFLFNLIAQDIRSGHSIVVFDARGDFGVATLELCARAGVKPGLVRIIDLREKVRPMGFNPLAGPGEAYFKVLSVLSAIEAQSDSWGHQLAETMRHCLILLSEAGRGLPDLERVFYDAIARKHMLRLAKSEATINFWLRFGELSPERQAAYASPVSNKISLLLATPTLQKVLGHPAPVNLGQHLDTPGSVLIISLAIDETHNAGLMMGGLILSAIRGEIFTRVEIPENQRNPVHAYVDECHNFDVNDFEKLFAEGRRFRIACLLAHQNLAQLSTKMRQTILGNVGLKVLFRMGREDSSFFSRDVFGDPRAYDFTQLPVGQCLVWQRELGTHEIETNEPPVRNTGELSAAGREFLHHVYDSVEAGREVPALPTALSPGQLEGPRRIRASMEDWLCD